MGLERTVSYFEVTGSKQASTVMGSESTVMGSESTVMGSESTVMGSDTAVTGSGTVPVPGKPQDACCPSRGLQSDLTDGWSCLCEGIRHSGAPGSLVVSLTISVRRESAWHPMRMFWGWPDFCHMLAQLFFCSFAQHHCNFRKTLAKVPDAVTVQPAGVHNILL